MEQVLELREQLEQFAIIKEIVISVYIIAAIEIAFILLYTCMTSTTKN